MAEFSVPTDELAGFPRLEASTDGRVVGRREWKLAGSDANILLRELIGGSILIGDTPIFDLPAIWPDPDFDYLRCAKASVEPFAGTQQPVTGTSFELSTYDFAKVIAIYEPPSIDQPDIDDQVVREERIEFSSEYMTLSTENMAWDSGGAQLLAIDVAIARLMGTLEYVVRFPFFPNLPIQRISDSIGKVNIAAVSAFNGTVAYEAETLLFLPPSASRVTTITGTQAWSIMYRLSLKETGWNKFLNPKTGTFDPIFRQSGQDGGGNPIYALYKPHPTGSFVDLI